MLTEQRNMPVTDHQPERLARAVRALCNASAEEDDWCSYPDCGCAIEARREVAAAIEAWEAPQRLGEDLSYYLGPGAENATPEQQKQLDETFAEARDAVVKK